jgi:ELWxxDGT repeat protein
MVEDINPTDSAFPFSESTRVAKAHGVVYFGADDGVHGEELWRSDGTPIGTHMVKDINPAGSSLPGTTVTYGAESRVGSSRRPDSFVTVDGILYFSAVEHASGTELWRTDGTEDGTWRVKNINRTPKADDPTRDGSSWPGWLTRYKGTVLFAAQGRGTGVELWRSDGTGPGTYRVKDIRPDAPSYPGDLTRLGNRVFFRATTEAAGTELWRTDGTRSGTMLFAELRPGTRSSSPKFLEVVNH